MLDTSLTLKDMSLPGMLVKLQEIQEYNEMIQNGEHYKDAGGDVVAIASGWIIAIVIIIITWLVLFIWGLVALLQCWSMGKKYKNESSKKGKKKGVDDLGFILLLIGLLIFPQLFGIVCIVMRYTYCKRKDD